MKILATADIHLHKIDLTKYQYDLAIIAGDLFGSGADHEIDWFLSNFKSDETTPILYVPGNHDRCVEAGHTWWLPKNFIMLSDESITIKGIRFYGFPWTLPFYNWSYMATEKQIQEKLKDFPGCDVLISHGPPSEILDKTKSGRNTGSTTLKDLVLENDIPYHIFGHIHEAHGIRKIGDSKFMNVSFCNRSYRPVNPPILFEL